MIDLTRPSWIMKPQFGRVVAGLASTSDPVAGMRARPRSAKGFPAGRERLGKGEKRSAHADKSPRAPDGPSEVECIEVKCAPTPPDRRPAKSDSDSDCVTRAECRGVLVLRPAKVANKLLMRLSCDWCKQMGPLGERGTHSSGW